MMQSGTDDPIELSYCPHAKLSAIILIAAHNRREITLRVLRSILESQLCQISIEIVLFDDGSSDGTSDSVRKEFPSVHVLSGDGSLYWTKSMKAAEVFGLSQYQHTDFIVWLNDDVDLFPDALCQVIAVAGQQSIGVGLFLDPMTKARTYGGHVRLKGRAMRYRAPNPGELCSTMNGNLVVIPTSTYRSLGGLDERYSHGFGDFDFGLRASRFGIRILETGTAIGYCPRNGSPQFASSYERWLYLTGRKGVPLRDLRIFLRRHHRFSYPLQYFVQILSLLYRSIRPKRRP